MPFQDSLDRPDDAPKRVCLGRVAGVHGIKGLVKVLAYGDDVQLIEDLSPVYTSEAGSDTISIRLKNPQGKHWLAEIEGVGDRNGAEALKGTEFYVERDALPDLEDGAFYYEDLIGREACDAEGQVIGKVIAVHNFGAGDLLEIRLKSGQDVMVPLNDDFVPDTGDTLTVLNHTAFL